jgi:hypothetical protein
VLGVVLNAVAILLDRGPNAAGLAIGRQPPLGGYRRVGVAVLDQDVQLNDAVTPRAVISATSGARRVVPWTVGRLIRRHLRLLP